MSLFAAARTPIQKPLLWQKRDCARINELGDGNLVATAMASKRLTHDAIKPQNGSPVSGKGPMIRFSEAMESPTLKQAEPSRPLSAGLAGSAARTLLLLWQDHMFGVVGRLLLPLDLVCLDLLLAGPLSRGLGRLVTHDRLPQLESVVLNSAHQGGGAQHKLDRSGEISNLERRQPRTGGPHVRGSSRRTTRGSSAKRCVAHTLEPAVNYTRSNPLWKCRNSFRHLQPLVMPLFLRFCRFLARLS